MSRKNLVVVTIAAFFGIACGQSQQEIENAINFTVFVNSTGEKFLWPSNASLDTYGCSATDNITLIVHGWLEGIHSWWVDAMIGNFSMHRGGCVIFMDYHRWSNTINYFSLVGKYEKILEILVKRLRLIGNYERIFMFGFSFGARLSQGAGYNLTMDNGNVTQIGRMDLCDPAGPGFDISFRRVNPQLSAKDVQCIATSTDKGTNIYDCHQNFRMGVCGRTQPATGPFPKGSHGLCPHFYNLAFDHDFKENNLHKCKSDRTVHEIMARKAVMGFRNRARFTGDLFVATARCEPYLVIDGNLDNWQNNTSNCG